MNKRNELVDSKAIEEMALKRRDLYTIRRALAIAITSERKALKRTQRAQAKGQNTKARPSEIVVGVVELEDAFNRIHAYTTAQEKEGGNG